MYHPFASLIVITLPPLATRPSFASMPPGHSRFWRPRLSSPPQSYGNTAAYPKANKSSSSHKTQEAHLAQKTLEMRLPISNHPRNSQKRRNLQRHL
jgi:hypothetical protein